MHCKHCGNQIDNDSKFCSFCGGKVDPPKISQPQIIIETPTPPVNLSNPSQSVSQSSFTRQDNGLLIAFIIMVGLRLYWIIFDLANKGKDYLEIENTIKYFIKPTYLIFWAIPIVLALYVKRKEQKIIMLILGIVALGWSIYENYIKNI